MIIGLYDADMSKYIHVPFSLELMKISSYYKKEGDIVSLSPSFSPELYNKFIYRKDFYDGYFPKELLTFENIEYGGKSFDREKYLPLNEDIEKQKADVYIYERFRDNFCNSIIMKKAFNSMIRAEHFRLSLDGKNIWENFYKQINITSDTHTLFLHDYNLNSIENSFIILKELEKKMSKKHKAIANKFPIQIDNFNDLNKWISFEPSESFFNLQYNGLLKDEELYDFIKKQKGTTISKQTIYNITENVSSEKDFIKNYLKKLFRQVIFLKQEEQKIKLKYDKYLFKNKQWERVIDMFQAYLDNTYCKRKKIDLKNDSLYNYANRAREYSYYGRELFLKPELRELFSLVKKENYECFKDFYECHTVKLKGGIFQNE